MTNKNCEILNDVTKTLIDSRQGYENAYDMADENYALRSQFQQRANARRTLVNEFQQQVRSYGETPQDSGGVAGAMHRGWQTFTGMFQKDEKAALAAIDEGEEYLADTIEGKLKEDGLDLQTRVLLEKAHASAKTGERWADMMENRQS